MKLSLSCTNLSLCRTIWISYINEYNALSHNYNLSLHTSQLIDRKHFKMIDKSQVTKQLFCRINEVSQLVSHIEITYSDAKKPWLPSQ